MPRTAAIRDNPAASPRVEMKTPGVIKPPHVLEELQDAGKSRAGTSHRRQPVLVFRRTCLVSNCLLSH